MIKEWFSAIELAGGPGLPETPSAILRMAKREGWKRRKRNRGKGGEYHISSLPTLSKAHLLQEQVEILAPAPEKLPKSAPTRDVVANAELADWQRKIRDARLAVLSLVNELRGTLGKKAVDRVVDMAASGTLPEGFADAVRIANARSGTRRNGLTRATIYRWEKDKHELGPDALAPAAPTGKAPPEWLGPLLRHYQKPSNPSVAKALRDLSDEHTGIQIPSLRNAQRIIEKLPAEMREYGRKGPRAMRAIQPFVRRTFDCLWPMDIVTVDGHLAKCYVHHPHSGRRIRPELTTYLDIGTRKALSFSSWWAESQYAIWLALRTMVLNPGQGIAAIQYSDRGAYTGQEHRALLDRLGTDPMFSLPYRAQARGVIERFNSSVWVPLAKSQPTYCGKDTDQEAFEQALKTADDKGIGLLDWPEWLAACEKAIATYNDTPHSSLKRGRQTLTPNQAWAIAQEDGWIPTLLEGDDLHDLLPSDARRVTRGEVSLPWGRYFHQDLRAWHGRLVRVHYDPADGARAWVAAPEGYLICVAERDGNAKPYVHESQLEHARAKREEGRIARLERKIATVKSEETPLIEVIEGETYDLPILTEPAGDSLELAPELAARVEAGQTRLAQLQAERGYLDSITTDPGRYDALQTLRRRDAAGEGLTTREYEFMAHFGDSSYARLMDEMQEKFAADCAEQSAP